ncbi:MAG: hypothetical protein EOO24_07495 [Comamonadaceae bacterium]|nr:MAG: hypothetical protein EOO24_07495 [Comamonadaceae bacterium]
MAAIEGRCVANMLGAAPISARHQGLKTMHRITPAAKVAQETPPPPTPAENRVVSRKKTLSEDNQLALHDRLEGYVQQGTQPGDDYSERSHTAKCVKAALLRRRFTADENSDGKDGAGSTLDFGSHGPACMSLPRDLMEFLAEAAAQQGNPITTLRLPWHLDAAPPWLSALVDLETLEVHEFSGSVLDLTGRLPDHATVEIHASHQAALPTVRVDVERGVSVCYHLRAAGELGLGLRA